MGEKPEATLYYSDGKTRMQKLSIQLKRALHTFFDIFYVQYKSTDAQEHQYSKQRQKIYHTCNMTLYSLQLVSLVFPPTTPGWSSFSLFTDITNSVRGDYILVKIGLGMPCYFFAVGVTSIIFLSLLIVFVKSLKKLTFNIQNYKLTLTNGLSFIKNFSFVPFLCIFCAVQKFELTGNVDQYGVGTMISLPVPYLGVVSVVFVVILVFLALVENTFQYQQILKKKSTSIFSRAHSKIETLKIFLSIILVFSYFYLKDYENSVHLSVSFGIGLCQWYLYTFYQPFYYLFTNFTHSIAYLLLLWSSFVQLFALALPDSTTVFVLIVFVSPCLIFLQWELLKYIKKGIQTKFGGNLLEIENIYQCELLIRSYSEQFLKLNKLVDKVQTTRLLNEIARVFKFMRKKFSRSNLQAVWEFLFAYTLLKDEGLARIKLSGTSSVFDIEGSFLYYKYCKFIDDVSLEYLEEIDFVRFRRFYEQAKKQDQKTCQLQFEFWKELSSEKPNIENLEKIAYHLHDSLKKCKKILKKVTELYPNNQLILKLFGSFLLEVYNDTVKGYDLLSKAEHQKHQIEQKSLSLEHFHYFDDTNGILIISGEKESIGNIVSINNPACEIFKVNQNFAVNSNISLHLPPPFNNKRVHNDPMLRFIETSSSTSVTSHPFHNFFVDSLGFLIEVYMQIRCVALNDSLYFLVGVRKRVNTREVLMYEGKSILACTYGFTRLLSFSETEMNLKNCSVSSVIEKFEEYEKKRIFSDVFEYVVPETSKIMTFKFLDLEMRGNVFKYLLASNDGEEIEEWNTAQAQSFNDLVKKTIILKDPLLIPSKKGILKVNPAKKGLSVQFDLKPKYFYLPETDFKPGHAAVGKVKDVTTFEFTKKAKGKLIEDESAKESLPAAAAAGEIMDLGDIQEDLVKINQKIESMSDGQPEISPTKKSGTSIASSAQSSNASFTSSAEAQSLLSGVTTSMKSFKIAFFLTILIVNIAVIAMMIYLKIISNTYIDTVIINQLSDRRVLMTNLTMSARNLELLNYGLESYSEPAIRALMAQDLQSLTQIILNIESKLPSWDSQTQNFYNSKTFKTWDLIHDIPVETDMNLMNVMKTFVARASKLQLAQLSSFTINNSDFYFLYRNGLSESLSAVNTSITVFTAEQEKITESILTIVLVLASSAIILMILCFVAVLIPTLFSVEKSNRTVWKLFFLLPLDLVQEMRSRCEDRLEMTHGIETEFTEESSKFKSLTSRQHLNPKRKFLSILTRISIYYLISMCLFVFYYYFAYQSFGQLLKTKPRVLNTAGLRTFYTNSAYFWAQEYKYRSTNNSYKFITPDKTVLVDPGVELKNCLNALIDVEMQLVYGEFSGVGLSTQHYGLLYENACWNLECLVLKMGMHSGVLLYFDDVDEFVAGVDAGIGVDLMRLYEVKNELQYSEQMLFEMYEEYMTSSINFDINMVIWVTLVYCLVVMVMYLFVYIPIINAVKEEITKIWKLGRLIPIEHRGKIMVAFKQASGKLKKVEIHK